MAIEDLLKKALAAFDALSPEQQAEMMEEQRQSWVRGNVGLSRDEAAQWHEAEAERKRSVATKSKRLEAQIATHETSAAYFRSLTRPAPAASDTGLMTRAFINECDLNALPDTRNALVSSTSASWDGQIDKTIELVTRSQAEELLAAKDARIAQLNAKNASDFDVNLKLNSRIDDLLAKLAEAERG